MDPLPPIPTPWPQRWREFRIQVLPIVVFLITVAAIVLLWRSYLRPMGIVGEVEAIRVNVVATSEGTLTQLIVDRLEAVEKNQPLGQIQTFDPATHEASLKVIAADLKLMQARMDLDKQRNLDSFSRVRLDLLREKVDLNLAKVNLTQAESEYQRVSKLFNDPQLKVVTESDLQVALRDRDALLAEVNHRTELIAEYEKSVQRMESAGMNQIPPVDPIIEETIKSQQLQLSLLEKPSTLKAPMAGVVSAIYKRPGEKVVRGDFIATISATAASNVIGYVRQPISVLPTTNDLVTISTRSQPRQMATAPIVRVGAQLELINPLLVAVDSNRVEMGLPILVALPPGLKVLPGEHVDLAIQPAAKK